MTPIHIMASSSPELKTFHPFPRLPKELRDAIWDLAIRPDIPSAHTFTAFTKHDDAEWSLLCQHSLRHRADRRCSLGAPRGDKDTSDESQQEQFSWVRDNRSTYMIDSGLWTACWESREAVERRFKVKEWDIKRENWDLPRSLDRDRPEDYPDAPATASFTSNSEWQCCLTHPKRDLFVLRPYNVETMCWDDLEAGTPIQRKPHALPATTATTSRHQFHGNGCRFTEVREGDTGWNVDFDPDIFIFVYDLNDKVDEYFQNQQKGVSPIWELESLARLDREDYAPKVGILAYEEWDPVAMPCGGQSNRPARACYYGEQPKEARTK